MHRIKSDILVMVTKRNGTTVPFSGAKIALAVKKAMKSTADFKVTDQHEDVAARVLQKLENEITEKPELIISVEHIQDVVELVLMESGYHGVAKSYIIYREHRAQLRKRDIFKKRINLKPHEYPELLEYVDAIRHSYWIHSEFNFTSDIQDFKVNINAQERSALKHAMLAIAQIEVAVKTFWGDIYKKMPKPEIGSVGATFAESEVRHQDAYAHSTRDTWAQF
jgi:ribonucleoside-diphosphate reductase beta chain